MSNEPFDPYQNWLGVSTSDRSPNHYQLLKLDDFESDLEKINAAVDRQAAILQLVTGDEVETAKRLLAEVGQARLCLISESRKREYDACLREKLTGDGVQAKEPGTSGNDADESGNVSSQKDSLANDMSVEGVQIVTSSEMPSSKRKTGSFVEDATNAETLMQKSVVDEGKNLEPEFTGVVVDQAPVSSRTDLSGLAGLGADLQSERIESQKIKEKQDETIKLIMDKVLWISCGICLIAIVGVFISRSGGCNREPIVSDVDGESPKRSFSRKMNAERKLEGGFKSKIFTESEKAKLLKQGNGSTGASLDEQK